MRGRKPQSNVVKLLRGNPGKRPINLREPKHQPLSLECPEEITEDAAKAEWHRITGRLVRSGQVVTVDRATLVGYCVKYAQWLALEQEARKHPFIVRSPSGYPIPNPALGMANKVFGLMLKAAAELGITPSSRSRVTTSVAAQEDEIESAIS